MDLKTPPVADAALLILRSPHEVFEAFVDPAVTSKFWFTKGSGRLTPGATVRWDWEMYGVHAIVKVREVEPDRRILMDWGDDQEGYTEVEWVFEPRGEHTFLKVENRGFLGAADEQVATALGSLGGFTLVTAAAKAWLEHGINLELIAARHPDGVVPEWEGR